MIDFNVFNRLRDRYNVPTLPFLDQSRAHVKAQQPYQGLKILHHVPLTLMTVFKIETLLLGGATVTASCMQSIPFQQSAVDALREANVTVIFDLPKQDRFDFHLDCCAELLPLLPPTMGAVELTQTGSQLYQQASLAYPLVSIDDSVLKCIETLYGTGDGFYRALKQWKGDEIAGKHFVIFGYGKVGQGLVHALRKVTDQITVIDVHPVEAIGVNWIDGRDQAAVKAVIANAYCAVTATGVKRLLTNVYALKPSDFGACLLANMGADDEFGENFEAKDVLFDKQPLNFSLEEPTAFRYLDPVFYAHNSGIDVIMSTTLEHGYHPFPVATADSIMATWKGLYHE